MKKIYKQHDAMDCGPTCLRMIAHHYGRSYQTHYLRDMCSIGRQGVSLMGISQAAETIGLRSLAVKIPLDRLRDKAPLPAIIHWEQNHFVVLYKVSRGKFHVADPGVGRIVMKESEFVKGWLSGGGDKGYVLLLEETPEFSTKNTSESQKSGGSLKYFASYLKPHKKLFAQLFLGMAVGLVISLITPFLTQATVDFGIGNMDLSFVTVMLVAQVVMGIAGAFGSFILAWIGLNMGSRISISLVSDFLAKIFKLPIAFFETRTVGDIIQRIGDHERVQGFLTSESLSFVFSILTFFVFSAILCFYNVSILLVFVFLSILNVAWLLIFMKARRKLDNEQFEISAKEENTLVQMIQAAREIKIQGIERQRRWAWEDIAAQEFRLAIREEVVTQIQSVGGLLIGTMRSVLVSYMAARLVITGEMSLGMMLSTQYMVGQLAAPFSQLLGFIQGAQDAKISLERMADIYQHTEDADYQEDKVQTFPNNRSLEIRNINFRYQGAGHDDVLKDVSFPIPEGSVTAIVGGSGSGKTTLLKLLLNLYQPQSGGIYLGGHKLTSFDSRHWRQRCGTVMQDGYLFSDTLARNIVCDGSKIDEEFLHRALEFACLTDFVDHLPDGLETKIGDDGQELSGGQKQRILLARAFYKSPEFLLLDEATSALDATNESKIMANLEEFTQGRTVVIIAHRLSTVKNADQIIVLDQGRVAERGDHVGLVNHRGHYFNLVKNQLDLDG